MRQRRQRTAARRVLYGQSAVARCLLESGALANVTNGEGATPLHLASAGIDDGHHECVKVLLKFGANPRQRDAEEPHATLCGSDMHGVVSASPPTSM